MMATNKIPEGVVPGERGTKIFFVQEVPLRFQMREGVFKVICLRVDAEGNRVPTDHPTPIWREGCQLELARQLVMLGEQYDEVVRPTVNNAPKCAATLFAAAAAAAAALSSVITRRIERVVLLQSLLLLR